MYLFVEFTYEALWQSFFNNLHKLLDFLSAPVVGAVTLQLVEKDNRDLCGLSAVDPRPNCGLASALSSRMLPRCPGCAWLKQALPSMDSCWLVSANSAVASSSLGKGKTALAPDQQQQQRHQRHQQQQKSSSSSSAATVALIQPPIKEGQQQQQQQQKLQRIKWAPYCKYSMYTVKLK